MAMAAARLAAMAARFAARGARFGRPAVKTYQRLNTVKRGLDVMKYGRRRLTETPETGNYKRRRVGGFALDPGYPELTGGVGGTIRYRKQWINPSRRRAYWKRMTRIGRKYYVPGTWNNIASSAAALSQDASWLVWVEKATDMSTAIRDTIVVPAGATELRQKVRQTHVTSLIKLINPYSWAMKYKIWMGYVKNTENAVQEEMRNIQPDGNGWGRYNTLAHEKVYKTAFAVIPAGNTKSITVNLPFFRTIKLVKDGDVNTETELPMIVILGYPEFGSEKLATPIGGMNIKTGKPQLTNLKYALPILMKYHYTVPSQFNVNPKRIVGILASSYQLSRVDVDSSEKQEPAYY